MIVESKPIVLPRTYRRPYGPARGRGPCRMSRTGQKPGGEQTTDDNLKLSLVGGKERASLIAMALEPLG